MRTLILNALNMNNKKQQKISRILHSELENRKWDFESLFLPEKKIENCVGCGSCAYKTPGLCTRKDHMNDILREIVRSDLLLFFTPVCFGAFHWQLKKVVDRMLPLVVPVYIIRNKEIHFTARYNPMPCLLGMGILQKKDKYQEQIFTAIVERNAINMDSPQYGSILLVEDDDTMINKQKMNNILNFMVKADE